MSAADNSVPEPLPAVTGVRGAGHNNLRHLGVMCRYGGRSLWPGCPGRVTGGKISEERAADDVAPIMVQVGAFTPPWTA